MAIKHDHVSREEFLQMQAEGDLIMDNEATAYCTGFCQGFMQSFDGWNGQSFKDFDRPLMDSELFREKMMEKFVIFYQTMREQEMMASIQKGERLN